MRQANEDDDLSLVEGDLIEHIVKLSDPWWAGFGPGGKRGFFPGEFIVVPSYFRCHGNSFCSCNLAMPRSEPCTVNRAFRRLYARNSGHCLARL